MTDPAKIFNFVSGLSKVISTENLLERRETLLELDEWTPNQLLELAVIFFMLYARSIGDG